MNGINNQIMENTQLFLKFCAGYNLYIIKILFHKAAKYQIIFKESFN